MDRTSKILLAIAALGLWANASALWLQPAHAQADLYSKGIESSLSRIADNIQALVRGGSGCLNMKICD